VFGVSGLLYIVSFMALSHGFDLVHGALDYIDDVSKHEEIGGKYGKEYELRHPATDTIVQAFTELYFDQRAKLQTGHH
jgi:hypothetical protein